MNSKKCKARQLKVVNTITGKEIKVNLLVENVARKDWYKAYAKTLAEYIGLPTESNRKVLQYLILGKNSENLILGTQREIAKSAGVSVKTVNTVVVELKKQKMIKEIRGGCYFLLPGIADAGEKQGAAILVAF